MGQLWVYPLLLSVSRGPGDIKGDSLGKQSRRRAKIEVQSLSGYAWLTHSPIVGKPVTLHPSILRNVVEKYHTAFGKQRRRGGTFHSDQKRVCLRKNVKNISKLNKSIILITRIKIMNGLG